MVAIHNLENAEAVLNALDALLGVSGECFLTFDESGMVGYATRLAAELLNIQFTNGRGKICAEFITLAGKKTTLEEALSSQQQPALLCVRADGKEHTIALSALPDRRAVLIRRVTDIANEKNEHGLLDIVAHDLRGGLVPAKTYVQMLMSSVFGSMNEKQTEAAKIIDASLQKQEDRIAAVLDMIKAEENRLELQLESASLVDIVRAAVASVERDCKKHQIELVMDIDPSAALVEADVRRLQRVISSLLHKCLKHSKPKQKMGVELRYPLPGKARLRVWDMGSGSSAADVETLLESSRQQAERRLASNRAPNIELGAVFDIIQRHNGVLKVQTEEGTGTTYTLYLPVRRRDRTTGYSGAHSIEAMPLLVAGVTEAERNAILEAATLRKISLTVAEDGIRALALARSQHYPLVVLGKAVSGRPHLQTAIHLQRPEDDQIICDISSDEDTNKYINAEEDVLTMKWKAGAADGAAAGAMLDQMFHAIGKSRTGQKVPIYEPGHKEQFENDSRR